MLTSLLLLTGLAAPPRLEVTHLANAGVMLRCGEQGVVVDGFFRAGVAGYETPPADLREKLETARSPYDTVALVLATHRHADHFDAEAVARHLAHNPRARFMGSAQTAGAVARLRPAQVETLERPARRQAAGVVVELIAVPHNRPHRDTIEHTVHRLTLCGETVVVTGDAETAPADFAGKGLDGPVDVLVAPWWFYTSKTGRAVVDGLLRPRRPWAVHGNLDRAAEWMAEVRAAYPGITIGFSGPAGGR